MPDEPLVPVPLELFVALEPDEPLLEPLPAPGLPVAEPTPARCSSSRTIWRMRSSDALLVLEPIPLELEPVPNPYDVPERPELPDVPAPDPDCPEVPLDPEEPLLCANPIPLIPSSSAVAQSFIMFFFIELLVVMLMLPAHTRLSGAS